MPDLAPTALGDIGDSGKTARGPLPGAVKASLPAIVWPVARYGRSICTAAASS